MSTYRETFSYIWPTISKYKWKLISIFVLYAARPILANTIIPIFYKRIVDMVASSPSDRGLLAHDLFTYVILIAVVFILTNVFVRSGQFTLSRLQSNVMRDLSNLAFSRLQDHSYAFFANNFSGSLVNKSRKFMKSFETMHDLVIDNFWIPFLAFVSIFFVLFVQAHAIAYVFLGVYIFYIFITIYLAKRRLPFYFEKAEADSKTTGHIADSLTNIIAIKSSSATKKEIERFKGVTEHENFLRLRAWMASNKQLLVQAILMVIVQVACLFLAVQFWIEGKITAGVFVLIQSYSITIGNYFWDIGRSIIKFTEASSDMKEMVDILNQTPDILDPRNPEKLKIKNGEVEIKNIHFSYIDGSYVFDNFSLKINSGEKVGLVGHSGSGKSTITKLLMRFVDVNGGGIFIDGQNIASIKQDDLRHSISYISQEPILFHRTIRENIAYSRPEAGTEEIINAARKAHAHEFITNLNHGYETLVGERGVKLSGGERQRVAIARAMLKNSPILILDEATSSLDSISESYIQEAFSELMKGKTTLVIAHRLSTIQKMDRIIVLDKGKIVEEGTHKELLARDGVYADLWNHQTGGFLE